MEWEANCRGLDPHGVPLVAIRGSEQMNAVDRKRLIEAAPRLLKVLQDVELLIRVNAPLTDGCMIHRVIANEILKAKAAA